MRRLRMLVLALLTTLPVVACAVPSASSKSSGSTSSRSDSGVGEVDALLAAGRYDSALKAIDRYLPRTNDGEQRCRLELARATALAAQGRTLSALSAHQRAVSAAGHGTLLEARATEAWADTELRSGQASAAARHYDTALKSSALSLDDERRLLAARIVAAERVGDTATSQSLRSRLGLRAASLVATARQRLAIVEAPKPAQLARGPARAIPQDPRALDSAIHTRGEWGARSLRGNHDSMSPIVAITVHHSAMPAPGYGQAGNQLQQIQRNHQDDRGWADIGYHFLIDPQGNVWEGRRLDVQGAHAGDSLANAGNIGVCLLGNFDVQSVPSAQARALTELLDTLIDWFDLGCDDVWPHQHYRSDTACPGSDLKRLVSTYRSGRPMI